MNLERAYVHTLWVALLAWWGWVAYQIGPPMARVFEPVFVTTYSPESFDHTKAK